MSETLKFGNGIWATKKGSTLAYNSENGNFKPLPFTFDRSTSATRVNKEGLIEVVSNNEPRIDFKDDSKGALLLEPQSTNLVTHSEDFSNASWTKLGNASGSVPILTSNYALSPDGTQNATRLQCDLNGGVTTSDQSIIYDIDSSNTSQTISIYLKSNNGQNQEVYLANTFGANDTVLITSKWKRYVFTHTSSNHTFSLGTRGSTGSSDVLDILIWGAQSESGNLSSYIPTQGSIGTRVAESCSDAGNEQVINSTEGVLYAEIEPYWDSTFRTLSISDGSTNNAVSIQYYGNDGIQAVVSSGGVLQYSPTLTGNSGYLKVAVNYKVNNLSFWVNGVEINSSLIGTMPVNISELSFSRGGGSNNFFGKVKDLRVYDTALSNAELQALTS